MCSSCFWWPVRVSRTLFAELAAGWASAHGGSCCACTAGLCGAAAASLMIVSQAIGDYAAAERLGVGTVSVGLHNLWLASQSSSVAAIV